MISLHSLCADFSKASRFSGLCTPPGKINEGHRVSPWGPKRPPLKIGKDMETFWKILTQYLSHIYTTFGEVSNFSGGGAQSAQYSTP